MALSPMTLSQPQCSAVHKLATFSHVNKCETTTALDRAHFAVFVRIRRHWRKLAQPCLKANLSRTQKSQEPAQGGLRSTYKSKRGVWDKKKVKPHRTTQGKWPETVKSGWQMAKAEWMADGAGRKQAEGTVQQMSTEDTRGQQHM